MRTPSTNSALEFSLSRSRLEKYLELADGSLENALTLYERNTRLSEAFYTPLQHLEICFRNKLNCQMASRYGEDWLTNGTPRLDNDARELIQKAHDELRDPTPDKVVAELRFAFWVGLIGPRYDDTLWRKALYKAFLAKGGQKRSVVHGRFNAIRRFRNRIAHHEPIFQRPVERLHGEVLEAIGWMCPETASWTSYHSRFSAVFTGHSP